MEIYYNPAYTAQQHELIQHFLDLVCISSPSLQEKDVAAYIKSFCLKYNIKCHEDNAGAEHNGNAGNIIATIPGNGKTKILFSAHMDTVLPCTKVTPVIRDGIIYSDGTSILGGDDKSGITAMLALMKKAAANPQQYPDMIFVFSIGEEIGLLGARSLDDAILAHVEAGFILDSGGKPGEIVIGAPYMAGGKINIHGKEAHAGNAPENGINALVVASHAISQLTIGRIDEETTCNIGTVQGGLATNIVMADVSLGFEARSRNKEKLLSVLDNVKATFASVCETWQATFTFDVSVDTVGYHVDENSAIVQRVIAAAHSIGLPAKCKMVGGASDTNIYQAKQVTAITLATGMSKVHTVEEYIAIQDLIDTANWVEKISSIFA